jgi:hypothetical protein
MFSNHAFENCYTLMCRGCNLELELGMSQNPNSKLETRNSELETRNCYSYSAISSLIDFNALSSMVRCAGLVALAS